MSQPNRFEPEVFRPQGTAPLVLLCEHASHAVPACYDGLGLSAQAAVSHAAWDIGALDVARALCDALDAPLVAGSVSRLVYDCNRPLEARDCIPARSEIYDVPGNAGLDTAQKQARFDAVHTPFHDTAEHVISTKGGRPAIVTIHSFTPVYNGVKRAVEIGLLSHGTHDTMAQAALVHERANGRYAVALNQPYDASDGVTYSLQKHGVDRGLPCLMIEIRNDLIDTPQSAAAMAAHMAPMLRAAMSQVVSTNGSPSA